LKKNPGKKKLLADSGAPAVGLPKTPTGIQGLDEITGGGLPTGRPTLICGGAGCGKTLLSMEFLISGALKYGEPGVFMSFEESGDELAANVRSLGHDLDELVRRKLLEIDHVQADRSELDAIGDYDLDGLFLRLGSAIDAIGAKRVVLDAIESLFAAFDSPVILRAELRRLFRWLKDRGVTAIVTGERGDSTLTRRGLEEYVSDCVIVLDHRLAGQVSTRRLRIVKYRGSFHGTNEYPFLITQRGLSVLPVTSLRLDQEVSSERHSTGLPRLDSMLGGGLFRGSSVLVSGTAGTCKTTLAALVAEAACSRGERCLYFAFEESPSQICRNMRSVDIDLAPWLENGLLQIRAERPMLYGLESHLVSIHQAVEAFQPKLVVLDPISNFTAIASDDDAKAMLTRLLDYLKVRQITAFFTNLAGGDTNPEETSVGISSLMDTWLQLRGIELNGERNRGLYILKSRGTNHSNQIREFVVSDRGLQLLDAYTGPAGVLTGSARLAQESQEQADAQSLAEDIERRRLLLAHKRQIMEAQRAALTASFEAEAAELENIVAQDRSRIEGLIEARTKMAESRRVDVIQTGARTKGKTR
jgi:circadian clock protein KaiC